jgi:hypothetical protein
MLHFRWEVRPMALFFRGVIFTARLQPGGAKTAN